MERQEQMDRTAGRNDDQGMCPEAEKPEKAGVRRGPSWRGWLISVLVAIILSVSTTLLLGGSLLPSGGGCVAGAKCSPAAAAGNGFGNPASPDVTRTQN